MANRRPDPDKLRRLRQIIQGVFFIGFVILLAKAIIGKVPGSWVPLMIFSAVTLALTLILGRVWCGWVCPMGTILYWTRFKETLEWRVNLSSHWWSVKYILLFLILVAVALGQLPVVVDWMALNPIDTSIIIILLLVSSVALNLVVDLFWCRYLCPLGGVMAILSKVAPMQRIVRPHCNDCSVCVSACAMGAIDPRRSFESQRGSCTVCIDCLSACTSSSNGFQFIGSSRGQR